MNTGRQYIRKLFALFFIALANIAVLVHIIVPHSHHDGGTVFCLCSGHEVAGENHCHDCHGEDCSCFGHEENSRSECSIQDIIIESHDEDGALQFFAGEFKGNCDCAACFLSGYKHGFNVSGYLLSAECQQKSPSYIERATLDFSAHCLGTRGSPVFC